MQNLKCKMQNVCRLLALPAIVLFSACGNGGQPAQQSDALKPPTIVETGKAVFQQNCTTCHLLKGDATGPALQGVLSRWDGDTALLRAYIRNPQKMIDDKEPHALKAYEKWKPTVMTPFPKLDDADINALIAYFQSGQ